MNLSALTLGQQKEPHGLDRLTSGPVRENWGPQAQSTRTLRARSVHKPGRLKVQAGGRLNWFSLSGQLLPCNPLRIISICLFSHDRLMNAENLGRNHTDFKDSCDLLSSLLAARSPGLGLVERADSRSPFFSE